MTLRALLLLLRKDSHPQKKLLKAAKAHAVTKGFKKVFFSPTLRFFNYLFFHRTVRNRTDLALNVKRFEQSVCRHEQNCFGQTAAHAGNIKIKRSLKKKGLVGYRKFVQVMKCVQVQKNATKESGVNDFNYLLHFFAGIVVLSIPSFLNFVNPFIVKSNFNQTISP